MSGYVYRGKGVDVRTEPDRPAPGHGTDSGYYNHLRITKTVPCDDCLRAHAAAERVRYWRRKKAS